MPVTHLCKPGLVCSTPHPCKLQCPCHSLYRANHHIWTEWRLPLENCESHIFLHLESYRAVPWAGCNQLGNNTDEDWISASSPVKAVIVQPHSDVMLTSLTWSFTHYQVAQQQQKYHSPSAGERAHNQATEEEKRCWFMMWHWNRDDDIL